MQSGARRDVHQRVWARQWLQGVQRRSPFPIWWLLRGCYPWRERGCGRGREEYRGVREVTTLPSVHNGASRLRMP